MVIGELTRIDQHLGQWAACKLRQGCSNVDIALMIREAAKVVESIEQFKPDYLPRFNAR